MTEGRIAATPVRKDGGRLSLRAPEKMTPEQRTEYDANPAARTNIARMFAIAETMAPVIKAFNIAMATTTGMPWIGRRNLRRLLVRCTDGAALERLDHGGGIRWHRGKRCGRHRTNAKYYLAGPGPHRRPSQAERCATSNAFRSRPAAARPRQRL